jgi:hypothetical protein
MEKRKLLIDTLLEITPILITIALAVISRLLPHLPNATPIAALALFSGSYLLGWKRFAIPLLAMLVSDFFLGFHTTMIFVYGSFALTVLLGTLLQKKHNTVNLIVASLSASILFFLITNAGVWITSNMYAHTISGLRDAYIMGIPFFRNTIIGDLFYTFSIFYGYVSIKFVAKKLISFFRSDLYLNS